MDAIERAAFVSVARACGFAWLGIFCIAFSLSFEPPLAAFSGGILCLIVSLILIFYAVRARRRPYKKTELWLILPKENRPEPAVAQQVIGGVLRDTYFRFARQAVVFSVIFLALSVGLRLVGLDQLPMRDGKARADIGAPLTGTDAEVNPSFYRRRQAYP